MYSRVMISFRTNQTYVLDGKHLLLLQILPKMDYASGTILALVNKSVFNGKEVAIQN